MNFLCFGYPYYCSVGNKFHHVIVGGLGPLIPSFQAIYRIDLFQSEGHVHISPSIAWFGSLFWQQPNRHSKSMQLGLKLAREVTSNPTHGH